MANSLVLSQKKSNKLGLVSRLVCLIICLVCSMVTFSGCVKDFTITNSENATVDARGNLRLLAPHVQYNYTVTDTNQNTVYGEDDNGINSGSISWDLSYYAYQIGSYEKVITPEADGQYFGSSFYTVNPNGYVANPNLSQEDIDQFVSSYSFKGNPADIKYDTTNNRWYDNSNNQTLYQVSSDKLALPCYQIVLDGKSFVIITNIKQNQPLIVNNSLNVDAIYFTYLDNKGDFSKALSKDFIKVVKSASVNTTDGGTGSGSITPFGKYTIVFNPALSGNTTNRSIKVKALTQESDLCKRPGEAPSTNHYRGDSAYSTVVTFRATKLCFSSYSSNSAQSINDVGYLTYGDDIYDQTENSNYYYFEKSRKTVTQNPTDSKIIYLEGYFPEGRIVKVGRERANGDLTDYALSSWTTNVEANSTPVLTGTLPTTISNFFNYVSETNNVITQNRNTGAFVVKTVYSDESHTPVYVNRSTPITIENKNNLFYENLNIAKTDAANDATTVTSTISVVANRNNSGYTFYANFTKVKNFTQSGTVFAGDDFFNSNSEHYLTGYTISIYEVGSETDILSGKVTGYSKLSLDTYTLKSFTPVVNKTNGSNSFNITTEDGRAVHITVSISGATFSVTGLEHNMCVVFDKVNTNSQTGVESVYSFHNPTMSNIILGNTATPTRALFVAQCDKTLCGVIGTEFEESSNIEVIIKQVADNNIDIDDVSEDVSYEIIKSVTTKEDAFGYVTSHILLSVIVPNDHLLVRYNLETPLNSTQVKYKNCTCSDEVCSCVSTGDYIYYNATTNTYYKTETQAANITSVSYDGTANYLVYNDQVYAYSFRDSSFDGTKSIYNSYYYGNYETDEDGRIVSFECITASTTGNTTTYKLVKHTTLASFSATNPVTVGTGEDRTIISSRVTRLGDNTTLADTSTAVGYLNTVIDYLNNGNAVSGILFNNETSSYDGTLDTIYYFEITSDGTDLTVSTPQKHICEAKTNSDISTNAYAYRSNLTNGIGAQSQPVYFYYDIVSKTILENNSYKNVYFYTSPIGRLLNDGRTAQWFYEFNYTANDYNIVLGSDILEDTSMYADFYSIMGEKIVSNYYYYVTKIENRQEIQVRQYNDFEFNENSGALALTFAGQQSNSESNAYTYVDENGTTKTGTYTMGALYNLDFNVYSDSTLSTYYKNVSLDGKDYRISFNPTDFTFNVQVLNNGALVEANDVALSFSLNNGGYLYTTSGEPAITSAGDNTEVEFGINNNPFDKFNNSNIPDLNNFNYNSSGTYESQNNSAGTGFQFIISYSGFKKDDASKVIKLTYDGNWRDENNNIISDINDYLIFPSFKFYNGGSQNDLVLKLTKLVNGAPSTEIDDSTLVTDGIAGMVINYYFKDASNTVHVLNGKFQDAYVLTINREAYTLDANNQKHQITVWGKFIPTSDPSDPIIYPSFSTLIEQPTGYILDPSEYGFYYDIDYSSEKALKEGFIGVNWLAGAPYPNPVLYFSVRHKINEKAQLTVAVDIKPVFYAEVVSTSIENDSSNLVFDFSTYSFKDTLVNIDANEYINNVYYVLDRTTFNPLYGFKVSGSQLDTAFITRYGKTGAILKVNEIYVNDDGYVYWLDSIDANGSYSKKVYIQTTIEYQNEAGFIAIEETINRQPQTSYYRPLKETDCYAWKTSKKYIKEVGYFDIHGYDYNSLNGQVVFNSGELPLNEVCKGISGLSLGSINNDADRYNYDQVIIAGTTNAYRTSYSKIKNLMNSTGDLIGYSQTSAFPVIDSYNTNETYFIKNKECVMFVTNPIVNTEGNVYYRFLEWRIYSRYNSGIMYYDQAETAALGNQNRYSWSMAFTPEHAGRYVIMPVYERMFEVSVSTEVENGPQNQGGSIIIYYKDGQSTNLDNITTQDIYSIEYLKTEIGGKLDYFYTDFEFVPYAYFDADADAIGEDGKLTPSNKYSQIIKYTDENGFDCYYGIRKDNGTPETLFYKPSSSSSEIGDYYNNEDLKGFLFKLTIDGNKYVLAGAEHAEVDIEDVLFSYSCARTSQSVKANDYTALNCPLVRDENKLYVAEINELENQGPLVQTTEIVVDNQPVAKLNTTAINVVETQNGVVSSENGSYYYVPDNNLLAGQEAYDDDGLLVTTRVFKTTHIDRESEVMLSALPDEGYRLLGWYVYDEENNTITSLLDLYGKGKLTFSKNDLITRAYSYNGNYYYDRHYDNVAQAYVYEESDLVPDSLLYKVRGNYINTGSAANPNYVEVFYSAARDKYYYDSIYSLEVDEKLLTIKKDYMFDTNNYGDVVKIPVYKNPYDNKYYTTSDFTSEPLQNNVVALNRIGQVVSNVTEMTHVNAIIDLTPNISNNKVYMLNNLQVYLSEDDNEFYRAYNQGNVTLSGNDLIIKSLHTNLKIVAVFREVYQSMIITDSEVEFGVTIEGVYYFNPTDNNLANRVNDDGKVVAISDIGISVDGSGIDYLTSDIDENIFKLYDTDHDIYKNRYIYTSLINHTDALSQEYDGYVSVDDCWNNYVFNAGLCDVNGKLGKAATRQTQDGSFALENLSFDDNTSVIIVVKTLASSPLQLHTLGLPSEYNFEPIFYPSDNYIQANSSKTTLVNAINNTSGIIQNEDDIQVDYLYYMFKVTYDRDPLNDYFDLIVHPTREISTSLDILTGNYNEFYSKFFDIELKYNGLSTSGTYLANSAYMNMARFFNFEKIGVNNNVVGDNTNLFNLKFKNGTGFYSDVINTLLSGASLNKTISLNSIQTEIESLGNATANMLFYRFTDFLHYVNFNIMKNEEQFFKIGNVKLNAGYVEMFTDAIADTSTLSEIEKAYVQDILDEMVTLRLLSKTTEGEVASYNAVEITTETVGSKELYYIDKLFKSLEELKVENERPANFETLTPEEQSEYTPFVSVFDFDPVGDGSVNFICFTAITMYNFSVQSLTIDGYDENGDVVYADNQNSHKFGSGESDNFVFYTSVGTNNRTYLGYVPVDDTFSGIYYNGQLTGSSVGTLFNKRYIDTDPDYQNEQLGLPSYVYKDFLLAKDTLLLLEGLKNTEANNGYQFMGWYQQKRINSIYDRFFDLEGNKLNVIDFDSQTNYSLKTNTGDHLQRLYYNDILVEMPEIDTDEMTSYLYFINKKTLQLYRQDGLLIDSDSYKYIEWASMELVSTTFKYPYIAQANADTVITALFKKITDFTYSFNPLEMTVTSSTSYDSLGQPLKYTVNKYSIVTNNGETVNVKTVLEDNIVDKEAAYLCVHNAYNNDSDATYEIVVTGKFYIDANPTLSVSPIGGTRLDGVYGIVKDQNDSIIKTLLNDVTTINNKSLTLLSFSNNNSLADSNIEIAEDGETLEGTYHKTNLAGVVYVTAVLNNLALNGVNGIDSDDIHITFGSHNVTLLYTKIDGFINQDQFVAAPYEFVISKTANVANANNLEFEDVYLDTRLLSYEGIKFSDLTATLFANKFKSNFNNDIRADQKTAELAEKYSMESGFIDEWLSNILFMGYRFEAAYNAYSDEALEKIAKEDAQEALNEILRSDANSYYFIEFDGINLEFYTYFDCEATDVDSLKITTIASTGNSEKAIDHWYINAQKPSTISYNEENQELNAGITFPTVQEIYFEKPNDSEYNEKYVLSKNNSVYFINAVIEKQEPRVVEITLQNSVTDTAKDLDELGVTGNTDNAFSNLIEFTYTGLKFASPDGVTDRNIDTNYLNNEGTNTNGSLSTKLHTGRYATNTIFTLHITDSFIVIDHDTSYANAGDVYAFAGWAVGGKIRSTDTSFVYSENGSVQARFVKIAYIDIVNAEGGKQIRMEDLEIKDKVCITTDGTSTDNVETSVFGYYQPEETYYAMVGANIEFALKTEDGYILDAVKCSFYIEGGSEPEEFNITVDDSQSNNNRYSFNTTFERESKLKLIVKKGIRLTVTQLVFNDYNQTTKGALYKDSHLYQMWRLRGSNFDIVNLNSNSNYVFAENATIMLNYNNRNNRPYTFIGWYKNNKLITDANGNAVEEVEFSITEDTVLELRLAKMIYLSVDAVCSFENGASHLNFGVTIDSLSSLTSIVNNKVVPFTTDPIRAGEKLKISIGSSGLYTFAGWYLVKGSSQKLISTKQTDLELTLNGDNEYLTNTNTLKLTALFVFVNEIVITKEYKSSGVDVPLSYYDVVVTYTTTQTTGSTRSNVEVKTSLGENASITIRPNYGSKVKLEAIVDKDVAEECFFESYRVNSAVLSYNEEFEITANSNSGLTTNVNAVFVGGSVVTVSRRLNDDFYVGDAFSVNVTYALAPTSLQDAKVLEGDEQYIQLPFTSTATNSIFVATYSINDPVNYKFVGWYVDNKEISQTELNYTLGDQKLTISNPTENLYVEARVAELANITLERQVLDQVLDGDDSLLEKTTISAHYNRLNSSTVSISNLYLRDTVSNKIRGEDQAYKYTTAVLTASRIAGLRFVGFKVNDEFVTKTVGGTQVVDDGEVVNYYLGNSVNSRGETVITRDYTIVACYKVEYVLNLVKTVMGSTTNDISFVAEDANENQVKTIISNDEITTLHSESESELYRFVGMFDGKGNTVSESDFAQITNSALVNSAENGQIFIEARYTTTVTITIEVYDRQGDLVTSTSNVYNYGVETTIENPYINGSWVLPNPDGSNIHYAIYSTSSSLTILPLENKTYYISTVLSGSFSNELNVTCVTTNSSTGLAQDGTMPYASILNGNDLYTTKVSSNSADQKIDSVTIDTQAALNRGYLFLGWVGAAKYIHSQSLYYFPISNQLTLTESMCPYNDVFAVFVEAKTQTLRHSGTTHIGSFKTDIDINSTYSLYNMIVTKTETNGTTTIYYPRNNTTFSSTAYAISGYNLDCAPSSTNVETLRAAKTITLPIYSGFGENRIAIKGYQSEIIPQTNNHDLNLTPDSISASNSATEFTSTIQITPSDYGTIRVFTSNNQEVTSGTNVSVLDNIFITSTPNESCYLSHYKITRHMDNGARLCETLAAQDITVKYLSLKVLDGSIIITPIFRKTFDIIIDNNSNATDHGDYVITDISESTDTQDTKLITIVAKDGYRIAGISIDRHEQVIVDYGEAISDSHFNSLNVDGNLINVGSTRVSSNDDANKTYITRLVLEVTRQTDINISIAYQQVKHITLVDGSTTTETSIDNSSAPEATTYLLYTDDSTLTFNEGTGLFETTIKHLTSAGIDDLKNASPYSNLLSLGTDYDNKHFLGYYYNNEIIPSTGLDLTSDTRFRIVALYVLNQSVDVSIGLYNEDESQKLNTIDAENNRQYLSAYNTPNDGFSVKYTKLASATSPHTDVVVTPLISEGFDAIYTTQTLSYFTNDNISLNAYGNQYFAFAGWYSYDSTTDTWTKLTVDNNGAINPNIYSGLEKLEARFVEKVRTIKLNPNYNIDLETLGSGVCVGKDIATATTSIASIYQDASNPNNTFMLNDHNGRNIVIDQVTEKVDGVDTTYWVIKYSIASSILNDQFVIKESNFEFGLEYYSFKTTDEQGNPLSYKFKNFTQINNKVLSTYVQDNEGRNPPYVIVKLEEFYNNQNLNINAIKLINIQYTLAANDPDDVTELSIALASNGEVLANVNPESRGTPYSNLVINVWVEEGSLVDISALSGPAFNTIAYSKIKPIVLTKTDALDNEYIGFSEFSGSDYDALNNTPISNISISDLTFDHWKAFVEQQINANTLRTVYANLTELFPSLSSGRSVVESISQYSFIASENIYFLADYVPLFDYKRNFVNAFVVPTDKIDHLTESNAIFSGNTFGIVPKKPYETATMNYNTSESIILDVLDRNNAYVGPSSPLSEFTEIKSSIEGIEYEGTISTRQTSEMFTSNGTNDSSFGENAIRGIVEKLANISVVVGTTTATNNSTSVTGDNKLNFNKYTTVLQELLETLNSEGLEAGNVYAQLKNMFDTAVTNNSTIELAEQEYRDNEERYNEEYPYYSNKEQIYLAILRKWQNEFLSAINALNDVSVSIENVDDNAMLDSFNYTNRAHDFDNWEFDSFVNGYLTVGTKVNIRATIKQSELDNWFFKGFMIVNSAATNNINLFVSGKKLETSSTYHSYTIIPREEFNANSSADLEMSQDNQGNVTYIIKNMVLSGDTQIVALYEKRLCKIDIRLKNNNETVDAQYNELLREYANSGESLEGTTIAGIDLDNDPNSSSGIIASNTTVFVREGEPAVVSIINRPFSYLIGWASNTSSTNNFVLESGKDKKLNELDSNFFKPGNYTTFENSSTLTLVDQTKDSGHNLYIKQTKADTIIGAYFAPMSYVISIVIKETDIALDKNIDGDQMSGYVSIIETTGEGENQETTTSYIETVYDENGKLLPEPMKVKLSLISINNSLIDEIETIGDVERKVKYLKYKGTNNYVLRHYVKDGHMVDERVEIIPNKVSTDTDNRDLTDEETDILQASTVDVELTQSNFYRESNLTAFNYDNPDNSSIYFYSYNLSGQQQTYIRPGLISVSYNNKRAIDLESYHLAAVGIDENGNELKANENGILPTPKNYKINLLVTAKANVGFPTVKIITNSPEEDRIIIPYTFDDSDYLTKLKKLTQKLGKGTQERNSEVANSLSVQNLNTNHDVNMVSGFYTSMFENTSSLKDPIFDYKDCNFTLTIVYARKVTPLIAELLTAKGDRVTLTSRETSRKFVNDKKNIVLNNLASYSYYIVKNGSFIANKIMDMISNGDLKNYTDIQKTGYAFVSLLSNFPKINGLKGESNYNLLDNSKLQFINVAYENILTTQNIRDLFEKLVTNGYISNNFDPFNAFTVTRIDAYKWYTGRVVTRTRDQIITEELRALGIIDRMFGSDEFVSEFTSTENETANVYYNDGEYTTIRPETAGYTTYNADSSESFSPFFVKSGDGVVAFAELALQFQKQRMSDDKMWGDKAKLYYLDAQLGFKSTEMLGRLMFSYNNDITYYQEQMSTSTKPTTWQEFCNYLGIIFNNSRLYQGTYVNNLISAAFLNGDEVNDFANIQTVLNIGDRMLAAYECPFWINEKPWGNVVVSYGSVAGVLVAMTISTIKEIKAEKASGGDRSTASIIFENLGDTVEMNMLAFLTIGTVNPLFDGWAAQIDWSKLH